MVVEDMDGVVKLFEAVVNAVPPVDAAYQSITLPEEEADINTVPVPQRCPFVPDAGAVRLTVAITAVREDEIHPEVVFRASA